MNTVDFFGHKVSKLIVGDNPINGHSYIEDKITGKEMKEFYTSERIKEALFEIEEQGYNTMLPLADPYIIRILQEYQREGGRMQFIFHVAIGRRWKAMDYAMDLFPALQVEQKLEDYSSSIHYPMKCVQN